MVEAELDVKAQTVVAKSSSSIFERVERSRKEAACIAAGIVQTQELVAKSHQKVMEELKHEVKVRRGQLQALRCAMGSTHGWAAEGDKAATPEPLAAAAAADLAP